MDQFGRRITPPPRPIAQSLSPASNSRIDVRARALQALDLVGTRQPERDVAFLLQSIFCWLGKDLRTESSHMTCSTSYAARLIMAPAILYSPRCESMSQTIEFRSHVPNMQRPALESLVFFNTCQERVTACIADAIEKFGAPEIVADRDRLRIGMQNLRDVQSLFAVDSTSGRPVGVAVYAWQDIEHVTVMHLSIAAEFASGGPRAGEQLLLRLLREVRRSTRRVKGARRLELYYATGRAAGARWRVTARL